MSRDSVSTLGAKQDDDDDKASFSGSMQSSFSRYSGAAGSAMSAGGSVADMIR